MASTSSSRMPPDDKLLPSLLGLCREISTAKPSMSTGTLQKRNIASLLRRTQLISVLFEELLRLDPSAARLSLPAILCLREILAVFRSFQSLLHSCTTSMSRMRLSLQSSIVSHKFHRLAHDLSTLLDIFPFDELAVTEDVRDVVHLLKDQCTRETNFSSDADEESIRLEMLQMVDEIEKEIVPQRSRLEEIFAKLGLDNAQACMDEISKLELEIRDGVAGHGTESLIALLGLVRYAKCVLFGASTPRHYSSSAENDKMGRTVSSSDTVAIPEDFCCPITIDLMRDPVVVASGQTYDRDSIEHWFKSGNKTCPKTRQVLQNLRLIPNLALKNLIARWCRDQKVPFEDSKTTLSSKADGCSVASNKAALEAARMTALFLVQNLSNNSTTVEAKNRIVHELRQLAMTGQDNRVFIGEAGAIPLLFPLLRSTDPSFQVNAMAAVLNLSILDENKKRIMKSSGGVDAIIALLKSGATWHAKKNAAATLLSLASFHSSYSKRIGRKSSVAVGLADLVMTGPTSSKGDGLMTILNLAGVRENNGRLVEGGVIPAALEAVATSEVAETAVAVLAAIAKRGGAVEMGATLGFVEKMVWVLRRGTDRARECAASALVYVCRFGGDWPVEVLTNIPGIEWVIWGLMASGSSETRRKAAKLGRICWKWTASQEIHRPNTLRSLGYWTAAQS